jgi:hypothetical protein
VRVGVWARYATPTVMTHDLTVFICGTFADLKEERLAVLEVAEALRVKYDAMEYFGARDSRPLEVCLDEVRRSDLLVVIVGHRYGSIAPGIDISFSQAEYQLGVQLNKPCYVFMASDDVPLPPRDTEQDPEKLRKLQAWKRALAERHTVAYFSSPRELATRVVAALTRALEAQNALPSVRGVAHNSEARDVLSDVEQIVADGLAAGYPRGILTGTIRAALAGFARPHEPLGIKVLILSGGRFAAIRHLVAAALEKEGADVVVEPLVDKTFRPGELTQLLESVEVVVVLSSGGPLPEPWLLREIEAAIWRFLLLPRSVELVPVAIDDAAVPPLLRARRHISISSDTPAAGVAEIVAILRNLRSEGRRLT